jgi:hypothetical protein
VKPYVRFRTRGCEFEGLDLEAESLPESLGSEMLHTFLVDRKYVPPTSMVIERISIDIERRLLCG